MLAVRSHVARCPRCGRPKLLDLFSCAGAAAVGYDRAGWCVYGVDIESQPRYPYGFAQSDALEYLLAHGLEFAAVHASPPCQGWSPLNAYNHLEYPKLIGPVRDLVRWFGLPYVIENVEAARSAMIEPGLLCGPMFGLKMYRHRLFEASFPLALPAHDRTHPARCARNGYLPTEERPFMSIHGGKHSRAWQRAAALALDAPHLVAGPGADALRVGIREVSEAIPAAYTTWVGSQLLAATLTT